VVLLTADSLDYYKGMIQEQLPQVHIGHIKVLGEGWRSTAVLVNKEWVFRFPKGEQAANDLRKELSILPRVAKRISIAIPEFVYVGEQSASGMPFVGYKKLPGDLLGESAVPDLSFEGRKRLARELASFMDELSSVPVDEAREAGVPERVLHQEYAALLEEAKQSLFPLVTEPVREYILSRFEDFVGEPTFEQYSPTLNHGDLSPDHFVVHPADGNLIGIIDFGDLFVGDPDYDYIYLLEDCGEDFTRRVMVYRQVPDVEACLFKVSFFVTFDQLAYTLEGIRRGEKAWIKEGLDCLLSEMKSEMEC
jgi:aminoglycoside 2''-phosphotransferase